MIQVSIIIPVKDRKHFTQNILVQLSEQIISNSDKINFSIIIIDDGSSDGTPKIIKTKFPHVYLIEGDGNLWWTGAIVKGMEYALENLEPDYFLWLNDDIFLADNFICKITQFCLNSYYHNILVGGIVLDKKYLDWIVYSGFSQGKPIRNIKHFQEKSEINVEVLSGNIVLIPKIITDKIGLPNAKILPHHGGDYEYIKRAIRMGFSAILTNELEAHTHFKAQDFLRYMPYWMQWCLQPSLSKRWEIVKGLSSRKANQNVELFVNIARSKTSSKPAFAWEYLFCYLNKVFKLLVIRFINKNKLQNSIDKYFQEQEVPLEMIREIKTHLDRVKGEKITY